jgi:hypothetical protein
VGVSRALTVLKTLTRIAPKPAQAGFWVQGQTLAVNLPTPHVTRDEMIGATGLFDIAVAGRQQAQAAQNDQGGQQTFKSSHSGLLLGVYPTESVPSVDYQGTVIAFQTQMAKVGRMVDFSAEISGIVEFQPLLQDK